MWRTATGIRRVTRMTQWIFTQLHWDQAAGGERCAQRLFDRWIPMENPGFQAYD